MAKVEALVAQARGEALEIVARDQKRAPDELCEVMAALLNRTFDPQFQVGDLSSKGIADREVRQRFKDFFGRSVKDYLTERKADVIRWLLVKTDLKLGMISQALNYSSQSNLSSDFKRWTGEKPTAYRAARRRRLARAQDWRDAVARLERARTGPVMPWTLAVYRGGEGEARARQVARAFWRMLREETPAMQQRLLQHHLIFGHRALFDLLLEKSRAAGRQDRRRGVVLMEVAVAAVEGSAGALGEEAGDLRTLAWAWLGNARSMAGDFDGAEPAFKRAREAWKEPRLRRDLAVEGTLLALEGTWRLFQRRSEAARSLLDRAIDRAERAGDADLEVRSRLQRAAAAGYQGRFAVMMPDLDLAAARLEARPAPDLTLLAGIRQEQALAHLEMGELARADMALMRAQEICTQLEDPPNRHQLRWIEALIAWRRGDTAGAERLLRGARAAFLGGQDLYSAAMVALDLAMLCHRLGRMPEVIELVGNDVLPVLEKLELHGESRRAAGLLESFGQAQAITFRALEEARAALRFNPRAFG